MKRPKIQVCCIAFREEKMVLIRRVKAKANTYMQLIPPGGHIENCEELEEAALRELEEETGVTAYKLDLVGVISFITYPQEDHAICFVFFSHENSGEIEAKEAEKVIPEWVNVNGFEDNEDIPLYYRQFLEKSFKESRFINCVVKWDNYRNGIATFS